MTASSISSNMELNVPFCYDISLRICISVSIVLTTVALFL